MKNSGSPSWMSVTQVRIFAPDEIPISLIRTQGITESIRSRFQFRNVTDTQAVVPNDPRTTITFSAGQFERENEVFSIPSLSFEFRRILLTIEGTSEVAGTVFASIVDLLKTIDKRESIPEYVPLFWSEETSSVIRLGFPIARFLERSPLEEASSTLEKWIATSSIGARITPSAIRFRVEYDQLPEELRSRKIQLLDKEVRIEMRLNTAPEDGVYFLQTPTSSDFHLEIIEFLSSLYG